MLRIHIGCGRNLLPGFVNLDNSLTVLLAKMDIRLLRLLKTLGLLNAGQMAFIEAIKAEKADLAYGDCLRLPFQDGSVDFCYSSHMLGWCLAPRQIDGFLAELRRVMKPGGGLRLALCDFDLLVDDYLSHRDTLEFFRRMPLGGREFDFKDKLKFLLAPNLRNGLLLNRETLRAWLERSGFTDIQTPPAGQTTLDPALLGAVDLRERERDSLYFECRKPPAPAHP